MLVLAVAPASAQEETCIAGRTIGRECVDPGLFAVALQAAVIFSQPKISHTAFPVLPSADRLYRYPNQLIPDQLGITLVGRPPAPTPPPTTTTGPGIQ
jgi:hypothetical protein